MSFDDKIDIAAFIMFSDVELAIKISRGAYKRKHLNVM